MKERIYRILDNQNETVLKGLFSFFALKQSKNVLNFKNALKSPPSTNMRMSSSFKFKISFWPSIVTWKASPINIAWCECDAIMQSWEKSVLVELTCYLNFFFLLIWRNDTWQSTNVNKMSKVVMSSKPKNQCTNFPFFYFILENLSCLRVEFLLSIMLYVTWMWQCPEHILSCDSSTKEKAFLPSLYFLIISIYLIG